MKGDSIDKSQDHSTRKGTEGAIKIALNEDLVFQPSLLPFYSHLASFEGTT